VISEPNYTSVNAINSGKPMNAQTNKQSLTLSTPPTSIATTHSQL